MSCCFDDFLEGFGEESIVVRGGGLGVWRTLGGVSDFGDRSRAEKMSMSLSRIGSSETNDLVEVSKEGFALNDLRDTPLRGGDGSLRATPITESAY